MSLTHYEDAVAEALSYKLFIPFGEASEAVHNRIAIVRAAYATGISPSRTASSLATNVSAHGLTQGQGTPSSTSKTFAHFEAHAAEHLAAELNASLTQAFGAIHRRSAEAKKAWKARVPASKYASRVAKQLAVRAAKKGLAVGSVKKPRKTSEQVRALAAYNQALLAEDKYLGSVFVNHAGQKRVEERTRLAYEACKRLGMGPEHGLAVGFEYDPREIEKPYVRAAVLKAKIATARAKSKTLRGVRARPTPIGAAPMMYMEPPGHVGWAGGRTPLVYEPPPRRVPLVYEPPPVRKPLVYVPPSGRAHGKSCTCPACSLFVRKAKGKASGCKCKCKAKCSCKTKRKPGLSTGATVAIPIVAKGARGKKSAVVKVPRSEARAFLANLPPGAWTAATRRVATEYGFAGGSYEGLTHIQQEALHAYHRAILNESRHAADDRYAPAGKRAREAATERAYETCLRVGIPASDLSAEHGLTAGTSKKSKKRIVRKRTTIKVVNVNVLALPPASNKQSRP